MKAHIFVYPGYVNFEVVLAAYFFKSVGEVEIVGLTEEVIESAEGFPTKPHRVLSDLSTEEVEVFIVPGGDPAVLEKSQGFYNFLGKLKETDCCIGAICAGPVHLARAGILNDRRFTTSLEPATMPEFSAGDFVQAPVVVDGKIVTANPEGYVDFALALGRVMNIFEDEVDYQETINFFKYHKR